MKHENRYRLGQASNPIFELIPMPHQGHGNKYGFTLAASDPRHPRLFQHRGNYLVLGKQQANSLIFWPKACIFMSKKE
jgi:hypothetical protein